MKGLLKTLKATSFIITALFVLLAEAGGQEKIPYKYQDLSDISYRNLKDSLKKVWVCPSRYKDKETQKKYKEYWNSRMDFITEAIENKNYIRENSINQYLDEIVTQIYNSNKGLIQKKPLLVVDRSPAVNAYSVGNQFIILNLGLLDFVNSREELALIIAHEIAHDVLDHSERSMKERSEWYTSDEYKKSLEKVLDSRYERYTKLKKAMESYTFSRTRHNRYHESEADSLAVVFLKNSRIPFDARFFLRLDSADMQDKLPLKLPVKEYFTSLNLSFDDGWTRKRSKGLSSKNYNFQNNEEMQDSLKTHPGCKERFARAESLSDKDIQLTPLPTELREKVEKMVVWNLFDNKDLTSCLYRVFLEKDKGSRDPWYDFMVFNVVAGLYWSDIHLNRFLSINVKSKEFIAEPYYELQTMLEQIPQEKLELYYKELQGHSFWKEISPDGNALKKLFEVLLNQTAEEKTQQTAARRFISSYPTSMYCEFADHFMKK